MAQAVERPPIAVSVPARGALLSRTWRRRLWATIVLILIIAGAIVMSMPLVWMISTSLKKSTEVFVLPPQWIPPTPQWVNYKTVFEAAPFGRYFLNSAIVTGSSVVGTLMSCSLAAYAFARLRFPGRDIIFVMLLSTLMLPSTVTIVPRFIVFEQLDWLNTFRPLIVPAFLGSSLGAFYIFLLREFFRTIPNDLEDAARLDGASTLRIFLTIALPLSKPALVTVALFSFINTWNDFLNPLLYLSSEEKYTIAIGVINFTGSNRVGPQMHLLMAASFLATIPVLIVFFVAQRQFVKGIVFSGLKG